MCGKTATDNKARRLPVRRDVTRPDRRLDDRGWLITAQSHHDRAKHFRTGFELRLPRKSLGFMAEKSHDDEPASHTARIASSTLWSIVLIAHTPLHFAKASHPIKLTDV
jgi:hypothetical protein